MLSGPHQVFAEGIAKGLNQTEAYLLAYPKSAATSAPANAARLITNDKVAAEVQRIRREAEKLAGSAILSLVEKRTFLAQVVRADLSKAVPGNLWNAVEKEGVRGDPDAEVVKIRLPDKLKAIEVDNDLASEGAMSGASDALSSLLGRIRNPGRECPGSEERGQ